MRPLPRLVGKAAAIGLLVAILALAVAALSPVLRRYQENEALIAERRLTLGRLEAIAAHAADLDKAARRRDTTNPAGEFLTGAGDALIKADLLARLKAIAAENGAAIASARPAETREEAGYDLIGLRIELSGPMLAVHRTLRAVEASVPPLFVDRAHFRAERRFEEEAHEEIGLGVQLDILGAVPRERPKSGDGPES